MLFSSKVVKTDQKYPFTSVTKVITKSLISTLINLSFYILGWGWGPAAGGPKQDIRWANLSSIKSNRHFNLNLFKTNLSKLFHNTFLTLSNLTFSLLPIKEPWKETEGTEVFRARKYSKFCFSHETAYGKLPFTKYSNWTFLDILV